MASFRNGGIFSGGSPKMISGIDDMVLVQRDGQSWIYTTSGNGGGMMALSLTPSLTGPGLALLAEEASYLLRVAGSSADVSVIQHPLGPMLVQTGISTTSTGGRWVGGTGTLGNSMSLSGAPLGITQVEQLRCGDALLTVTAERASGRITLHSFDTATRALSALSSVTAPVGKTVFTDDVTLTTAALSHGSYVLAATASGQAVVAYRVSEDHRMVETGRLAASDGVGISQPGPMQVVSAYGRDFVLAAAGQSSSVTVAELKADGSLRATDHLMDSLASRFGQIAAMQVVTVAGRPVVLVGGGDGGVSALMLLPDGRLVEVATQADHAGLSLAKVATVAAFQQGGIVHLYAAGSAETGITHLTLDLRAWGQTWLGGDMADSLTGGAADDLIAGGVGDDLLAGAGGDDVIQDGIGSDTMAGGLGADTFVLARDGDMDRITDFDAGRDRLDLSAWGRLYDLSAVAISRQADGGLVLQYGTERLMIWGRDGLWLTEAQMRAALVTTLFHLPTAPTADIYDRLWVQARPGADGIARATLTEDHGDAKLSGTVGRDSLTGNSHANHLYGYEGSDTLDGGGGADTLEGGDGNDAYRVDHAGDVVIDRSGYEHLYSTVSLTAPVGIESTTLVGSANLNLWGRAASEVLNGNVGANWIDGGAGNDTISGRGGADTILGGAGNDLLSLAAGPGQRAEARGGAGDDIYDLRSDRDLAVERAGEGSDTIRAWMSVVLPDAIEAVELQGSAVAATGNAADNRLTGTAGDNQLMGLDGRDVLGGGAGNDLLDGGDGNDVLEGGMGMDTLIGGLGNDLFSVDNLGDVIVETAAGGQDTVASSIALVIPEQIEWLRLIGAAALSATGDGRGNVLEGNTGANLLRGLGGNDTLIGGLGNDTLDGGAGLDDMRGGAGNDIYHVHDAADRVTELAGQGSDIVYAWTDYILPQHVEVLSLGYGSGTFGIGNNLNNTIFGNARNNVLIGLGGSDYLQSGAGDDTLSGDEGNDILVGQTGSDVMIGGTGNDTYYVDSVYDQVVEDAGAGTDVVVTSVSLTIPVNVEKLTLAGTVSLTATGGAGNDILVSGGMGDRLVGGAGRDTIIAGGGNDTISAGDGDDYLDVRDGANFAYAGAGNDYLWGNGANDTLYGSLGNDTYAVTSGNETIIEFGGQGLDVVFSSVSLRTLAANVENVVLLGSGGISAVGNTLGNRMTGNAGANVLSGGAGNDYLMGMSGNDTLSGQDGNDVLLDGFGNDVLSGGNGADSLWGMQGNDMLLGGAGNDLLFGNTENDHLIGEAGNDILLGGTGNDILNGGAGVDTLRGEAGADAFVFNMPAGLANADRIIDYSVADDSLWLATASFGLAKGHLAARQLAIGRAATTADHRFVYNPGDGHLSYDADGAGAGAASLIAYLPTGLKLTAADFLLY
ncbi:calcium-binding protein [Paracoccus sp. p4-l81]|uniref:calcium-binding protein n=1 Tax=Paracoccus sp. p4-l81 TaxID=3342806 RepID=UPI0035B944EA